MSSGTATLPFLGRVRELTEFKTLFSQLSSAPSTVLYYHGISQIGKTRLKKEFGHYLSGHGLSKVSTYLDFEQHKFASHSDPGIWILRWLRMEFGSMGVEFRLFDMAYPIYVQQVHAPTADLIVKDLDQWGLTGSLLSLFKDGVDTFNQNIPLFKALVTGGTAVVALGTAGTMLPVLAGLSFGMQFINLIRSLREHVRWGMSRADLIRLESFSALPLNQDNIIFDDLVSIFIDDINHYTSSASTQPITVFVDSYDQFVHGDLRPKNANKRSELMSRLMSQLHNVNWIVMGTDVKPRLDGITMMPQRVVELDETTVGTYFAEFVHDTALRSQLVTAGGGLPWLVEKLGQRYKQALSSSGNMDTACKLTINDHRLVVECFLDNHLNKDEHRALTVLAVPNSWNAQLFDDLIVKFVRGYSKTCSELVETFPFIEEMGGVYSMPERLRESLLTPKPSYISDVETYLRGREYAV